LPGLHCRADDAAAIAKIVALKGRDAGKSLLVLAGSFDQARSVLGALNLAQEAACRACWPGPFSLILPAGDGIAKSVTSGRRTLALRVPQRAELRELILELGVTLVSTSVNRAGEPPATSMSIALGQFGGLVDGYWSGRDRSGDSPKASALVDLTCVPFRVLRPGPEAFDMS